MAGSTLEEELEATLGQSNPFLNACSCDERDVAEHILRTCDVKPADINTAFYRACYNGNKPRAEWILRLCSSVNKSVDIHFADDMTFNHMFGKGDKNMYRWLLSITLVEGERKPINVRHNCREMFSNLFTIGETDEIKELYAISLTPEGGGEPMDIHTGKDRLFREACDHGILSLAQWLYGLAKADGHPFNIHVNDEDIFQATCASGDVSTVEWLYNTAKAEGQLIDIHARDERAFIGAYYYLKLNIAAWLINKAKEEAETIPGRKPIDMHARNNYAFYALCKQEYKTQLKWLIDTAKAEGQPFDINACINDSVSDTMKEWLRTLSV